MSNQNPAAGYDWADEPTPGDETHAGEDQTSRARSAGRVTTRPSRALTRQPGQRTDAPNRGGQTHFASVDQWVIGWLLPMWTRDLHGDVHTWCPQWWRHPEAVARLTALWLSWEHLRLDPATGMSSWWRDHADHQLTVLISNATIFKGCNFKTGHTDYPIPQLPSDPAPTGLFDN